VGASVRSARLERTTERVTNRGLEVTVPAAPGAEQALEVVAG